MHDDFLTYAMMATMTHLSQSDCGIDWLVMSEALAGRGGDKVRDQRRYKSLAIESMIAARLLQLSHPWQLQKTVPLLVACHAACHAIPSL